MSTKELDHNHRYEIKSPDDVSQLISKFAGKGKSNKVIWLALDLLRKSLLQAHPVYQCSD